MKVMWILMCLLTLHACDKDKNKKDDQDKPQQGLKIMTYNIRHGAPIHQDNSDVHLEGIAAVINAQKPDLVALQEVDSFTTRAPFDEVKELGKLTGMHYFFSKSINYQGGGYGVAVLSRFPILGKKHYALPMPDPSGEARSVAMITIEPFPGTTINFAATHLDLVTENRLAQMGRITDLSEQSKYPFIIAGDFNAKPDSKGIITLQKNFVFACVKNCPLTFPSDKPASTIDYVILNPAAAKEFHIVSYNAIQHVQASDHLPLLEYLIKQ